MADTTKQKVFKLVKEYLKEKPEGARYSEIIDFLKSQLPGVPENTLHGSVWSFRQRIVNGEEKEVIIPERGIYLLSEYQNAITSKQTFKQALALKENRFLFYT